MPGTKSLLRRAEYERLSHVRIDGRILDVGGSAEADYHRLLQGTHTFSSANITAPADFVFDAQEPWPVPAGSFDGVVLMNILEHLYDPKAALSGARAALRPGGTLVGSVPFMYNVHPSPEDYFRYTKGALQKMLREAGFVDIEVTELGTGAFSVIYHCLMGFMRWEWLAELSIRAFTGLDRLTSALRPGNKLSNKEYPLGYFFLAKAPGE